MAEKGVGKHVQDAGSDIPVPFVFRIQGVRSHFAEVEADDFLSAAAQGRQKVPDLGEPEAAGNRGPRMGTEGGFKDIDVEAYIDF